MPPPNDITAKLTAKLQAVSFSPLAEGLARHRARLQGQSAPPSRGPADPAVQSAAHRAQQHKVFGEAAERTGPQDTAADDLTEPLLGGPRRAEFRNRANPNRVPPSEDPDRNDPVAAGYQPLPGSPADSPVDPPAVLDTAPPPGLRDQAAPAKDGPKPQPANPSPEPSETATTPGNEGDANPPAKAASLPASSKPSPPRPFSTLSTPVFPTAKPSGATGPGDDKGPSAPAAHESSLEKCMREQRSLFEEQQKAQIENAMEMGRQEHRMSLMTTTMQAERSRANASQKYVEDMLADEMDRLKQSMRKLGDSASA